MNYIYISNGTTWTQSMKDYVEKSYKKLEKYLDGDPVKVSITLEGKEYILKSQVVTKQNKHIRAEEKGEEFYDLITKCRDSLLKQIQKSSKKLGWKERIKKVEVPVELNNPVVKVKDFYLEEITTGMAINEMERLGHDWYAFKDVGNDNEITIIYRRLDDDFAIIRLY